MAQIIPEDSLTDSHPGPQLQFCFQALDDAIICRQQMSVNHELIGMRYWINQGKQSLLIATLPDQGISHELTLDRGQLSKHPLIIELIAERDALFPSSLQKHAHHLLPIILLLHDNLAATETVYLKKLGLLAIGAVLINGAMPAVINRCLGIAASSQAYQYLRAQFSPELQINASGPNTPPKDLKLLDLEQEVALKKGLSSQPQIAGSTYSLNIVKGPAGSGKSEVLVKRAVLLHQQHPKSRILVLSHNKSISNLLKQAISAHSTHSDAIQCLPFHEWSRKLLGGTWRFVYEDQEIELFDLMVKRHFEHEDLNRTGLMREINFIKDRHIITEADYLSTLRSSHSLALPNPLRKRVWLAMIDIDTHLKDRNSSLWGDAAAALLNALDEGKTLEPYTHVLIDESQYFAPIWLTLITRLIAPQGSLFMTVDPDQGFYNRSLDTNETGLLIDSVSSRLPNHYRCNPAIARVVDGFRLTRSMDTLNFPLHSKNQIEPINHEDHPQLLHFPTKEDQKNRLFSEVHQLLQRGYQANDILILNADIQSTRLLAQEMRDTLRIRTSTLSGSMIIEDNTIKLCDIQSATGLQSKIVLIAGLEIIFNAESNADLSERERHNLQNDNTRLLHMAMTRASERLYLLTSTEQVPDSLIIEGLDTPSLSTQQLTPVRYLNP